MTKAHRALKVITAVSAAAVMVVAAGCGTSDNGSAGDSSSTESQSSQTSETTESSSEAPAESSSEESTESEAPAEPQTLNVWMQGDTLKDIGIDDLNAEFEAAHPGVTVNLQEQTWGEYTTKVLTGLADTTDQAPDVLELGNTQVAGFAADGALLELKKDDIENNGTWLKGLEESSTYDGVLSAIPYYAGVRAGIVRSDLAEKAGAKPPYDSLDDLQAAAVALLKDHGDDGSYSGLYFASQYWYEALSFIWDFGGDVATGSDADGWQGALSSDASKAGIQRLKDFYDAVSRNSGNTNELQDAALMAQEQTAMIIDPTWMPGVVTGGDNGNPALEGKLAVFAVPGHEAGTVMPQFLGGSDIAINAKSTKADLAVEYTKLLTGQKYQSILASKGYISNSTSIAAPADNAAAQVAVKAASTGRFIPNSKNWTAVEEAKVLPDMFNAILTGSSSIDDATADADKQIADLLNG